MKKIKNNKLDIIIYFLAKVFSGILSFVQVSILTYFLKPNLYGEYSLIIGLINILVAIFVGWLSSSTLRYYSTYKKNKKEFFANLFIDWFIVSLLATIVLIIISCFSINIDIEKYLVSIILLYIFNASYELLSNVLRAAKETILYFVIVVSNYALNIIFFILLYKYFNLRVSAIIIGSAGSYILTTAFVVFKLRLYNFFDIKMFSKEIQYKFLKYGFPMIGVWATSWILNYSDRYIIKVFLSSTEVGFYDISYKLAENSINMIITSLSMAMMPHLIETYNEKGIAAATEYHSKFIKLFYLIIIPAICGIISIRYPIYNTIINKEYLPGINILIYVSISMFFYGMCQFIYKLIQLKEKTNVILYIMICSVIINIVLNILFIPKYGYFVAAITTLTSNIISLFIAISYIRKYFKVNLHLKYLVKVLICSLVMYFIVSNIVEKSLISMVIGIMCGTAAYVVLSVIMKTIDIKYYLGILTKKNRA